jgi:hypothetical protein
MRDMNVEQLWYGLWLIKGMVSLSFLWGVAMVCKRLLRRILWNRVKRRLVKHSMVHSFGTLESPWNIDASESKAVDRSPNEQEERIG